jgi:hypothetical protein
MKDYLACRPFPKDRPKGSNIKEIVKMKFVNKL